MDPCPTGEEMSTRPPGVKGEEISAQGWGRGAWGGGGEYRMTMRREEEPRPTAAAVGLSGECSSSYLHHLDDLGVGLLLMAPICDSVIMDANARDGAAMLAD
jgi:hypothetical protein